MNSDLEEKVKKKDMIIDTFELMEADGLVNRSMITIGG